MEKRDPALEYWLLDDVVRRLQRLYCITEPNGHHDVRKFGLGGYTAEEFDGIIELEPDTRGYPWVEVPDFADEEALDYEEADMDEEEDFGLYVAEIVESVELNGKPLTIGIAELLVAHLTAPLSEPSDVIMQDGEVDDLGPSVIGSRKAVCREFGNYRRDGLGEGIIERRSKARRSSIVQGHRRRPEAFHGLRANRVG